MNIALILIGLTDAVISILGKINALRQVAKQSNELTPEQEAELDNKLKTAFASPAWQQSTPPQSSP